MNIYDRIGKFGLYSLLEGTDRLGNADTWFVDGNSGNAANSAGAGQGASWDLPFSTLNYAISRCSNDASNVILVAADHTENWTTKETASGTTTTGACVNKSGVTIIGFGTQDRRPTFLTTAAAGTLNVIATECSLYNLVFKSNYADTATLIITDSAGDGLLVENCEFRDSAANKEHKLAISIAANCDDTTIRGCRFLVTDDASASEAAIRYVGAHYRSTVQDCFFRGDWGGDSSDGVIDASTTASYDMLIDGNIINNMDATYGAGIEVHASTTGVVSNNVIYAVGTGAEPLAADGCVKANNLVTKSVADIASESGGVSISKHYYLDSGTGTDTNDGKSWATAFATIGAAIDACTADNGDVIHVAAGFAQTITGAATATEMDVDCNGISIVGEGNGQDRPTFTFATDAANAQCYVTGVDCRLENLRFVANIASLLECINVNADGLQVINCDFDGNTHEPLAFITCDTSDTSGGSRMLIKGCTFDTATGDTDWGIHINKDEHYIRIEDCVFRGEYDVGCVVLGSTAADSTYLFVKNNYMENETSGVALVVISGVAVTGEISGNVFVNDTRDIVCSPSKCMTFGNTWVDSAGTGGATVPNSDPNITAEVFFVDSGATAAADAVGSGKSWDEPFATLDYAIAFCTASQGAEIHLAPGHAETYAAAGANLTLDVVGVKIIGHGTGTDRPTFTFTTEATADIEVDAANCSIENVIFINDVTGLDAPIDVDAAHFTLKNCVTRDLGTDICDNWIVGDANADYLTIIGHVHEGTNSAGAVTWLSVTGAEFLTVKDCVIAGDFSAAPIDFGSAMTDVHIERCTLTNHNAVDVCIEGFAASTGMIREVMCSVITDTQTTWINTPGNMNIYECYGTNVVGEAGMVIGTVSQ